MRYRIGCRLGYEVAQDGTPFIFNVEAQRSRGQSVLSEGLTLSQPLDVERVVLPESGNRYARLIASAGALRLDYAAEVELAPQRLDPASVGEMPVGRLPLEVLPHLLPSRYVESDLLIPFAQKGFGAMPPGHARVAAVCNWVHEHLDYVGGSSDEHTSARDTLVRRQGVCRDYAHLAIGLCRALGIPARFVSAYAWRLSPPDFHAVMEAWLEGPDGGAWFLFDPTRMAALDGLVRMGVGRDAAEVAFCSPFGEVGFDKPEVWIEALDRPGDEVLTAEAVTLTHV